MGNRNRNIILGRSSTTGLPIVYNGHGNVLIGGKQGSGKTRRIGIPNLLRYRGSVLVGTDFKGQLAQMTALYRAAVLRQDVLIIDPFEVFKSPWISR